MSIPRHLKRRKSRRALYYEPLEQGLTFLRERVIKLEERVEELERRSPGGGCAPRPLIIGEGEPLNIGQNGKA